MHSVPDPYRVLGVGPDSPLAEIKAAHRRLAKRYHPDAPGGDTARFLAVQDAYLLLADPGRRRQWDAGHAPGPVRAGPRQGAAGARARAHEGTGARRDDDEPWRPSDRRGRGSGPDDGRDDGAADAGAGGGTYTWTAERVPWWQDRRQSRRRRSAEMGASGDEGAEAARDAAAPGEPAGPTSPSPSRDDTSAKGTRAAEGDSSGARGRRADSGGAPRAGDTPGARHPGAARGRGPGFEAAGATTAPDRSGGDPSGRRGPGDRARTRDSAAGGRSGPGDASENPGMDAYVRSSGAAWSAAARAYFRRATADMPSGARFGHSSWTGRVGWEPPIQEQEAFTRHARRGRQNRRAPQRGGAGRRTGDVASGRTGAVPPQAAGPPEPGSASAAPERGRDDAADWAGDRGAHEHSGSARRAGREADASLLDRIRRRILGS